jgi:hypothetical protein
VESVAVSVLSPHFASTVPLPGADDRDVPASPPSAPASHAYLSPSDAALETPAYLHSGVSSQAPSPPSPTAPATSRLTHAIAARAHALLTSALAAVPESPAVYAYSHVLCRLSATAAQSIMQSTANSASSVLPSAPAEDASQADPSVDVFAALQDVPMPEPWTSTAKRLLSSSGSSPLPIADVPTVTPRPAASREGAGQLVATVCAICELRIRGLATACGPCTHRAHRDCWALWVAEEGDACPSGCG